MRNLVPLVTAFLLLFPVAAQAQDSRAALESGGKALGATNLKSIEIQGSGVAFQVGQSASPGMPWPQFDIRTFTRIVNYETASFRQEILQTRALEPSRGGGVYIRASTSWSSRSAATMPGTSRATPRCRPRSRSPTV